MMLKGIKTDSLTMIINSFYNEHKPIIDVWNELMLANQTDINVNIPEEGVDTPIPVQEPLVEEKLKK